MNSSKYAGEFDIVLEKKNGNTVISEKKFNGLIKVSPTIHLDSEKISTYPRVSFVARCGLSSVRKKEISPQERHKYRRRRKIVFSEFNRRVKAE